MTNSANVSLLNNFEIVVIKGCFSGIGSMLVALTIGEHMPSIQWIICVMALGFVAYGLSIHFYIMAQKDLGAAKTSAYYSIAPFLGVAFSMFILNERSGIQFFVAFIIMVISTCLMVNDTIKLQHTHMGDSENHSHEHDLSEHQYIHYV